MKVAPLMRAIKEYNSSVRNGAPAIDARLLHTGQHYDEKMPLIANLQKSRASNLPKQLGLIHNEFVYEPCTAPPTWTTSAV